MTEKEARDLLEVEDDSLDPKALRRAYLRAVKRHKPESDPQGFQAVREAYELLQHADVRPPVVIDAPPSFAEDAEPPFDPLASYRERALEAPTRFAEARVWKEATQAHPEEVEAWRRRMLATPRKERAAVVAKRAYDAGHTEFLGAVLELTSAKAIPKPLWAAARRSDDPVVLVSYIDALVRRGHVKRAARAFERFVEADDGGMPEPMLVVRLVAKLVDQREIDRARHVVGVTESWLRESGYEREWLAGFEAVWLLVRELIEVAAELPASLRRAVAKALGAGRLDHALEVAARLDPLDAEFALSMMKEPAPNLASWLEAPLARAAAQGAESRTKQDNRGVLIFLFLLMSTCGRQLCRSERDPSPERPPTEYDAPTPPPEYYGDGEGPP